MAVPSYGEISSITQTYFMPKLVDNIFNSNALLQRWRKSNYQKIGGGTEIRVPLAYATTTAAGWYNGTDTLNVTSNDQIDAAKFDWKQIYGNITITRLDELKNSGKEAIVNFVKAKVQMTEKTVADTMGTALFNAGTTTNALIGLRLACQSSGYTYGGISKTTYSWWRGTVDASTVLSLAAMQGAQGDVQIDNDRPSVWVTTQNIFDDFYGLIQPQQRFMDSETAKAGFTNMLFNGKPVLVDSHCPASHMFGLNENYLQLIVHKDEDFRFEPFIKPTNQNVSTAKVYWTGALTCSNARMQVMFTSIA